MNKQLEKKLIGYLILGLFLFSIFIAPFAFAALKQNTGTATTTAAALGIATTTNYFWINLQNSPASAVNLLVGDATAQPYVLIPGASVRLENVRLDEIFVKSASATATWNWVGQARE